MKEWAGSTVAGRDIDTWIHGASPGECMAKSLQEMGLCLRKELERSEGK